jgi:hypothetical protein
MPITWDKFTPQGAQGRARGVGVGAGLAGGLLGTAQQGSFSNLPLALQ